MPIIVDAPVALAWALPDEFSAYADSVLNVVEQEGLLVPELWAREVANGLAISHIRKRINKYVKGNILRQGKLISDVASRMISGGRFRLRLIHRVGAVPMKSLQAIGLASALSRGLIVSALVVAASGVWAQQSAPTASDQMTRTAPASRTPEAAQCTAPAFDQQSIALFKQQAPKGDAAAQCGLGMMHYIGQGMPQDYTQAAFWFRKASERGNAEAQYFLGLLYHDGHGVPQNYIQAAAWWGKAAEQGDAGAQYSLGYLYCHGQGVAQDYTQASVLYRKAAEQGNADAQYGLGSLYGGGFGVPQDYTQAAAWFRKAAEQGNTEAQYLLGLTYLFNRGVPADYAEAYFWLDLAAAGKPSDPKQAAKFRDESASHLTSADLAREQERAQKWFEAHQAKPQ